MILKKLSLFFIALPLYCNATTLPMNLNSSERKTLSEIVGVQSSAKLLTHPYPLGGYSGLEIGLSIHQMPLTDFDTSTLKSSRLIYPEISIAKGLYNDIDVYFQFTPPLRQNAVSNYSVLLKWCFNQGMFLPVVWSVSVHTSSTNVDDSISARTNGIEITAGYTFNQFSIYGGVGTNMGFTRFIGEKDGVSFTDTGDDITLTDQTFHKILGFVYQHDQYFIATQADHYNTLRLSAKVGVRY